MAQGKNFINDLNLCFVELIDNGTHLGDNGEVVPYSTRSKKLLLRLVDYVKQGSWLGNNDTAKFVVKNFTVRQTDLAELWNALYPQDTKSAATFRSSAQLVNKQLYAIFEHDLIVTFTDEREEYLNDIETTLENIQYASIRIEPKIGANTLDILSKLPTTYKNYSIDDCALELLTIAKLSQEHTNAMLEKCNADKLSFVYSTLTKPSFFKGEFNHFRMEMINAYMEYFNGIQKGQDLLMGRQEGVVSESKPIEVAETDSDVSDVSDDELSFVFDKSDSVTTDTSQSESNDFLIAKEYIEGVVPNEDDFVNPDVIKLLASLSPSYKKKQLSAFTKEEVAYAVKLLEEGDEVATSLYNKELEKPIDMNFIGDYVFLPSVAEELINYSKGVESTGDVKPIVVNVIMDYMIDNFRRRLECLNKVDVATALAELVKDGSKTNLLIEKLSEVDTLTKERTTVNTIVTELKQQGNS